MWPRPSCLCLHLPVASLCLWLCSSISCEATCPWVESHPHPGHQLRRCTYLHLQRPVHRYMRLEVAIPSGGSTLFTTLQSSLEVLVVPLWPWLFLAHRAIGLQEPRLRLCLRCVLYVDRSLQACGWGATLSKARGTGGYSPLPHLGLWGGGSQQVWSELWGAGGSQGSHYIRWGGSRAETACWCPEPGQGWGSLWGPSWRGGSGLC